MVKELLFEGSSRYYDQALCTGLNITDEDIDDLCKAMKEQAVKNAHNEEQKAAIKLESDNINIPIWEKAMLAQIVI